MYNPVDVRTGSRTERTVTHDVCTSGAFVAHDRFRILTRWQSRTRCHVRLRSSFIHCSVPVAVGSSPLSCHCRCHCETRTRVRSVACIVLRVEDCIGFNYPSLRRRRGHREEANAARGEEPNLWARGQKRTNPKERYGRFRTLLIVFCVSGGR